jgi:23S rRNA (cytosine1962-C5)-methyltransferase
MGTRPKPTGRARRPATARAGDAITVTARGARRWQRGHPWIYRSDVVAGDGPPGIVRVADARGRFLGQALWSPASEIRLRWLTHEADPVDVAWWIERVGAALARRAALDPPATAYRVVHAEADGLPSLVVDRYGPYVVAQLLSAGLEAVRAHVLAAIDAVLAPAGVLLRHDAAVRRHERLPLAIEPVRGQVPDPLEVREGAVRYLAAPHRGQKTGAFLDQREHRGLMAAVARGRALDVFCYHGLFALHMAGRAEHVLAVDSSGDALAMAARNAELNGRTHITWREANAFDALRELERARARFDTIALDPPAFAKDRASVPAALRGYKEINLRALKLLAPGGRLFTASCSFHVGRAAFLALLADAAADAGRRVFLERVLGQPQDHPEVLTIPETGYLKGALVRAID